MLKNQLLNIPKTTTLSLGVPVIGLEPTYPRELRCQDDSLVRLPIPPHGHT